MIGDRHLLPAEGLSQQIIRGDLNVKIVVSDCWAHSHAGQLLVSCLTNLLCRQVALVKQIEISAARCDLLIPLPGIANGGAFPDVLSSLARWAAKGAVSVGASDQTADCTILVGNVPNAPCQGLVLSAVGTGWRAWVGEARFAPNDAAPDSTNPLGPFLAAALAAGEIFKHGRGLIRGSALAASGYSLWTGTCSGRWEALEDGPATKERFLPPVHVVGAGAVANAVAYIAAYLELRDPYFIVMDDDRYDDRNLNRCLLAGWDDIGSSKTIAIARFLSACGVVCTPCNAALAGYFANPPSTLRADVAAQIGAGRFGIVLSCVDRNWARHDIQRLKPNILIGGSTLNLQAKADRFGVRQEAACLGCWSPRENDGEKIHALERKLRDMDNDPQGRRRYLEAIGLNVTDVETYLAKPECGTLGEAAIKEYATRAPALFSVGFVSLGAGLLQVAALLRDTVFEGQAPAQKDRTVLSFLNGEVAGFNIASDAKCELRCQAGIEKADA